MSVPTTALSRLRDRALARLAALEAPPDRRGGPVPPGPPGPGEADPALDELLAAFDPAPVPPAGVTADGDAAALEVPPAAFDPAPPPVPFARTRTCSRCGQSIDWRRDGVPFLDGTCSHLACYEQAEDRPEVPPAAPPVTTDALAWARDRADGFGFAELLRVTGRTDVSALVAELRDAGFGKSGRAWREGGP